MFSARVHGWWPWSDISSTRSSGAGALEQRRPARGRAAGRRRARWSATALSRDALRERRMAGVDVLEQAVLDPVGRHEHHAGGVPLAARPSAAAWRPRGARVTSSTSAIRSSGRWRNVVQDPPLIGQPTRGPASGRVAVGRALRDHAAGDGDALDVGRRIGQRHVHQQRRPPGLATAAAARWGRGSTGTRPAAGGLTPGRYSRMSKTPCPAGSRPVRKVGQAAHECEGRQERDTPFWPAADQRPPGAAGRPARAAGRGCPSRRRPSRRSARVQPRGPQDTGGRGAAAPGESMHKYAP